MFMKAPWRRRSASAPVGEPRRTRDAAGSAVLQFAITGLVAVALVGAVAVLLESRTANKQAIDQARAVTRLLALNVIEPALTDGAIGDDPKARKHLDDVVRKRVLSDTVLRVKLWTEDGKIVYSDEPRLIGKRYKLGEDDVESLNEGKVAAEISDLSAPENRFERDRGKLLEVYLPVRTSPSGQPLLFETYQDYAAINRETRNLLKAFVPALGGALLLLWVLQIPLARSLARRLRASQREREALLLRAMEASDVERRRIAADLHDGVVQDLAGISFGLEASAEHAASRGDTDTAIEMRRGASGTRESMRQLRSLLVELHPPNLHASGLEPALTDLCAPLRAHGVDCTLEVDDVARLSPPGEELVFRAAQEALRNVLAHAEADTAVVRLKQEDGRVVLTVEDDGRGFTPEDVEQSRSDGHLGLSLLSERALDLGGVLNVDGRPGHGTRLRLEVTTP
jgi:two-component system, NarL family, sensor kinase